MCFRQARIKVKINNMCWNKISFTNLLWFTVNSYKSFIVMKEIQNIFPQKFKLLHVLLDKLNNEFYDELMKIAYSQISSKSIHFFVIYNNIFN